MSVQSFIDSFYKKLLKLKVTPPLNLKYILVPRFQTMLK